MPFMFRPFEIPGPMLIQPRVFKDDRGYFLETYKKSDFVANGIDEEFVQDNHSYSKRGVIRGLHYQLPPAAQGKLVRVTRGIAWDVAVDIRHNSPYFMKSVSVELSGDSHTMLYIPPGFAHGFVALTEEVHLLYKCTAPFAPDYERGIRWDDPHLRIEWPVDNPVLSEKDAELPLLENAEIF